MALAEQACELTAWKHIDYIDTLAAAYAERGHFERASRCIERAMPLADKEQRDELRECLARYRSGRPYYEPEPADPKPK